MPMKKSISLTLKTSTSFLLLAASVFALSGASGASDSAAPAATNPAMAVPTYVADPMATVTDSLTNEMQAVDPSGVVMVAANNASLSVDVYLTNPNVTIENQVTSAYASTTVNFIQVPKNQTQLNSLHQTVTNAWQSLINQGVVMSIWHSEVTTGKEYIGVVGLTNAQLAILDSTFGSANIDAQNLAANQAPVATSASRENDLNPFSGGDNLESTNGYGDCSSGYGVTGSQQTYLITAAHCFPVNDVLKNLLNGNGGGATVGTVVQSDLNNGGTDTELVQAPATDKVWTGIIDSPSLTTVSGFTSSPAGDEVCNSGAFSGEVCNLTIDNESVDNNNNLCITVSLQNFGGRNRQECHLLHANAPAGQIANQTGDSGGPVFRFVNGNLEAVGIVSASTPADGLPNCTYNAQAPNQSCFTDLYYTAISTTLAEWNVTLKTG